MANLPYWAYGLGIYIVGLLVTYFKVKKEQKAHLIVNLTVSILWPFYWLASLFGFVRGQIQALSKKANLIDLDKDISQIHQLGYFGIQDHEGLIDSEETRKLGAGSGVLTLKNSVREWSDFQQFDLSAFNYGFSLIGEDRGLLLTVHFHKLSRSDNTFYFLFDLHDSEVKSWLDFVQNTQTISLLNGPTSRSMASCVNLHLSDAREQKKLAGILSGS